MSAAALTPRVRILVVCDEVIASDIEEGVYTLEGVRQHVVAETLPCRRSLSAFLVLSCSRKGTYTGRVQVVDIDEGRTLRYKKLRPVFDHDNDQLSLAVDLGECEFPDPGTYLVQVWLAPRSGAEVQKGELTFRVLEQPE
jgi:hypothetical protein